MYHGLRSQFQLPTSAVLFKNSKAVVESRRQKLQEYLSSISEVAAIQPLLAEFLGISVGEFTGKNVKDIGAARFAALRSTLTLVAP